MLGILENAADSRLTISDEQGNSVYLPPSAMSLLRDGAHLLNQGGLRLVPVQRRLTTQEAGEILNVSRQYLVRLLDEGAIPFQRVGNRRRLHLADVLAYRTRRDATRMQALAELVELDEEAGLFATEYEEA